MSVEAFETMKLERRNTYESLVRSGAPEVETLESLEEYLYLLSSVDRGNVFLTITQNLPADLFWKALHRYWNGFDRIDHVSYEQRFEECRDAWQADYLPERDAATFNALPKEIEVFRGQCRTHPIGVSWTTSRTVAEGFAKGHRGIYNVDPVVHAAVVRKGDIASVQTSRQEHELVLFKVEGAIMGGAGDSSRSAKKRVEGGVSVEPLSGRRIKPRI